MSTSLPEDGGTAPGVKTLAVRLDQDLYSQLSLIAQLRGNTIVDEIRQAVAAHITALKAHPTVIARADDAIREIEAEAAERRQTLATLLGDDAITKTGRTRARKTAAPDTTTDPA